MECSYQEKLVKEYLHQRSSLLEGFKVVLHEAKSERDGDLTQAVGLEIISIICLYFSATFS
jgi:hypothetical protein